MKKIIFLVLTLFSLTMTSRADVIGEYCFSGTLGDNIGIQIEFAVNGDYVAVGNIVYTKYNRPITLVGVMTDDGYKLNEYKDDGTITGMLFMKIKEDNNGPYLIEGTWTDPKTGKVLKMKNMESDVYSKNNPWDYGDPNNLEGDYVYHKWDQSSKSMKSGYATFRDVGDNRLYFEITNEFEGTTLKCNPVRPAKLRKYTYNDFNYTDANPCGYSFEAHFFKRFVVLITSSDPKTTKCDGKNWRIDGVYFKQEFDINRYIDQMNAFAAPLYAASSDPILFTEYALIDIDRDGQPEVWVRSKEQYYDAVFSISDGKVNLLADADGRTDLVFFLHGVGSQGSCGTGCAMSSYSLINKSRQTATLLSMVQYNMDGDIEESRYYIGDNECSEEAIFKEMDKLGKEITVNPKWKKIKN